MAGSTEKSVTYRGGGKWHEECMKRGKFLREGARRPILLVPFLLDTNVTRKIHGRELEKNLVAGMCALAMSTASAEDGETGAAILIGRDGRFIR